MSDEPVAGVVDPLADLENASTEVSELPSYRETESRLDDPRFWYRLTTSERATYAELERQSPALAGLFFYGLQLTVQADQGGVVYMIAHAARELCKGVVHLRAGTQFEGRQSTEQNDEAEDTEAFATLASRAFGLPRETGIIREWAELQRYFNSISHIRPTSPDGREAAKNFRRLTELVFGVIAPYFVTRQELERILSIETPTESDEEELRTILSRPTLRRQFFTSVVHSGWIAPLEKMGVFDAPPNRNVLSDGRWSTVAWPEGEFLVRVAKQAPGPVAKILARVPASNDNPLVWDIVARAALELPVHDPQLTRKIADGMKALPDVLFVEAIHKIAVRAAAERDATCFVLIDRLFSVTRAKARRRENFTRIDNYDAAQILKGDLTPFIEFDGVRLLKSLLAKLYRLVETPDSELGEGYVPQSRIWCRQLDDDIGQADDGRTLMALTTAKVAAMLMARSEGEAEATFALLSRAKSEAAQDIEKRIRFFALARSTPHLRPEVNRLLMDPDVLSWTVPRREVGDVLRRRFEEASENAQKAFVYTLKRGPDASELQHFL